MSPMVNEDTGQDQLPVEQDLHVGPLAGLRVIDVATLFAAPMIATLLSDYGADVTKIEHPTGDTLRGLGWEKDGYSLWWLTAARNKRCVTLNLSTPEGAEVLKRMIRTADVLIENFRPGTLERWGLGWDVLKEINPRLVMVRTTAYGQTGPYSSRAGFGTTAESMTGFAHMNGYADGPPTLPPFALGDGVAAITGSAAVMIALYERDAIASGKGQMIDLSIFEPLFWILGPQAAVYDQLGVVQGRTGNRSPVTAPRNAYQSKDGVWLGLSASAQSIAERVMHIVGRPDLIEYEWFKSHEGRLDKQDELDEIIGGWMSARTADEALKIFERQGAALARIYSIADIFDDPQYRARDTITTVEHDVLGPVKMQGVIARLGRTPGRVKFPGGRLGEQNEAVFIDELGYSKEELSDWRDRGIV